MQPCWRRRCCATTCSNIFTTKACSTQAEGHLKKLESLNADYDALLGQLEGNPKELARLAPATLGIEPNEPNTAYPRATADKLAAARRALSEEPNQTADDTGCPAMAWALLPVAPPTYPVFLRRDFGADFLYFLRPDKRPVPHNDSNIQSARTTKTPRNSINRSVKLNRSFSPEHILNLLGEAVPLD